MHKILKKIFRNYWTIESTLALCAVIILFMPIFFLDQRLNIQLGKEMLIDIHGLVVSLFIYGAFLSLYNKYKENKKLKLHYHEEIEDYRDWHSEEAKFRILGNIKRLINLGETKFDLNRCYLKNSTLKDCNFYNSDFNCINLSETRLESCIFVNVNFKGANFSRANIMRCKFINCKMNSANYFDIIFYEVDFDNSDLISFDRTNNLHKARVIYNSKNLNPEIMDKIKQEHPDLLNEPDFKKFHRFLDHLYSG